jgi:predicted RNase H-like HicB family nuclease
MAGNRRGETMSTDTTSDNGTNRQITITLIENADSWTAHDDTRGLTTQGETRAEALASLDAVITAVEEEGGHEPTDEELRAAGIDPEENANRGSGELPDVLQ